MTWAWLCFLVGCCLGGPAWAGGGRLFVLGIRHKGGLQERATRAVLQRLQRMGEEPQPAVGLAARERACQSQECLSALSARLKAARLLGGEVEALEGDERRVVVWVFDAGDLRLRESAGLCEGCDEKQVGEMTAGLAGRLMDEGGHAPAAQAVVAAAAAALPPRQASSGRRGLSAGRRIAAGLLGGAALVGLGAGIAFSVLAAGDYTTCVLNRVDREGGISCSAALPQGLAWGMAGVMGAGLVLTIALPER